MTLIEEIRALADKIVATKDKGDLYIAIAIQKICDRHQSTEQGCGLKVWCKNENMGRCQGFKSNQSESEPLGELAKRKGYTVDEVTISMFDGDLEDKFFSEETYAAAESQARKYLESLPDREEK